MQLKGQVICIANNYRGQLRSLKCLIANVSSENAHNAITSNVGATSSDNGVLRICDLGMRLVMLIVLL
jgi:hypothetical protein